MRDRIKKIITIIMILCLMITLCSCTGGEMLENQNNTDYRILINMGSIFVYEIKDADTGVWYICANRGGITPKLNADGTLYHSTYNSKGGETQ